jgi:hypothetical protein
MPLISHHERMSAAEFERLTGMPSDTLVIGPPGPQKTGPPTEAAIFRRCRRALGLSLSEMASALLIASDRNLRRWEDGHHPVSGPAWVALEYMLREAGESVLAEKVAEVVEQRRAQSRARQQDPTGQPASEPGE